MIAHKSRRDNDLVEAIPIDVSCTRDRVAELSGGSGGGDGGAGGAADAADGAVEDVGRAVGCAGFSDDDIVVSVVVDVSCVRDGSAELAAGRGAAHQHGARAGQAGRRALKDHSAAGVAVTILQNRDNAQ